MVAVGELSGLTDSATASPTCPSPPSSKSRPRLTTGTPLPLRPRLALLRLTLLGALAALVHEAVDRVPEWDVDEHHQHGEQQGGGHGAPEDEDQQDEEDRGAERGAAEGTGPGGRRVDPLLARLLPGPGAGLLTGARAPGAAAAVDAPALGAAVLPAALLGRPGHILKLIRRRLQPGRMRRLSAT